MSKVFVRGGSPGKIRVGLEDSEEYVEIDSGLSIYQGLHELQPWLQALADAHPLSPEVSVEQTGPGEFTITQPAPKKGKTLPPKGDA